MPYFPGTPLDDVIIGSTTDDVIVGGLGNDNIRGLGGNDLIFGQGGTDFIYGYLGDDLIFGGDDTDWLYGEQGNDTLSGGAGNDVMAGGEGNDVLNGDSGNDSMAGGAGSDSLNGGSGIDTAYYWQSPAGVLINLGAGTGTGGHATGDTLTSIENVSGSRYNDILVGDGQANMLEGQSGADILLGMDGNDLILPGTGNDTANGGNGQDTVSYEDFEGIGGYTIDLEAGTATRFVALGFYAQYEQDHVAGFESAVGSPNDDTVRGTSAANMLSGGPGNDLLEGRAGNDTIDGGSGIDTMTGGLGADSFVFTINDVIQNPGDNWGVITDFDGAAGDRIDMSEFSTWYDPLSFVGTAGFSGNGVGEVRIAFQTFGLTILHVDTQGDGEIDGIIDVQTAGLQFLDAGDFVF